MEIATVKFYITKKWNDAILSAEFKSHKQNINMNESTPLNQG